MGSTETTIEQKYYTPNPEDLFIGYECEIIEISEQWIRRTIAHSSEIGSCVMKIDRKHIRVPYLTKEQIENKGWIFYEHTQYGNQDRFKLKGNEIEHYISLNIIRIFNNRDEVVFNGVCNSINEFIKIIKWTNIL